MERPIGSPSPKKRIGAAGTPYRRLGSIPPQESAPKRTDSVLSGVWVVAIFGLVGIGACIWGLVRYYTRPRPQMVVPAPAPRSSAPTYPGEIPAPSLE